MDTTNSEKPTQHMDNEASSTRCLRVSLIVRMIMKLVSNAELLQVSNVNKLWNYEARSVMRDRGCFIAHLKSGRPCQDLIALVSDIQLMNVVPFAGIAMSLDESHLNVCSLPTTPKLDSNHHKVLDQLPWKHLGAEFVSGHSGLDTNCPAFGVVSKVLRKFCGNLEGLSFRIAPYSALRLQIAVQDSKFPHLKTMSYGAEAGESRLFPAHSSFIHAIISRAGRGPVQLNMQNYMSRMESTLEGGNVELVANYDFYPARLLFSTNIMAAIRMEICTLSSPWQQGTYLPFGSFNRIVPVLLKSSRTSLVSLKMDLIHVLPLMCYGTVLENLVDLRINAGFCSPELAQPHMLTLLRSFDFTQLCPRLIKARVFLSPVSVSIPRDDITQFVEQANALPRPSAALDQAANIKHLSFSGTTTPEAAPFLLFAQMFPNITKLSFETFEKRKAVFGIIWKHWAKLEELEVRASFGKFEWPRKLSTWTDNLDSQFCGIFPQEVAELREKDDEYLRTVNIVPVMPSITCMKKLRTLRMLCKEDAEQYGENDPNFIFSKVTCLIAFARCPNLSVILETKSQKMAEALSHINPYIPAEVSPPRGDVAIWRDGTVVQWDSF